MADDFRTDDTIAEPAGGVQRRPLLSVEHVTRRFMRRGMAFDAVHDANLQVGAGEFVAIVGRSGNGKSTLINMIAGLVRSDEGRAIVDGHVVGEMNDRELSMLRNRVIGFVTQGQTLLSNLTAIDNVILPAMLFGSPEVADTDAIAPSGTPEEASSGEDMSERRDADTGERVPAAYAAKDPDMPDVIAPAAFMNARYDRTDGGSGNGRSADPLAVRALNLLERLGVSDLADTYPNELSGGEMRRISIARALMNRPKLLIADEPTGDLDQESTELLMRLLREQADAGMAILMVTHDPDAMRHADRVLRMDAGVLSEA